RACARAPSHEEEKRVGQLGTEGQGKWLAARQRRQTGQARQGGGWLGSVRVATLLLAGSLLGWVALPGPGPCFGATAARFIVAAPRSPSTATPGGWDGCNAATMQRRQPVAALTQRSQHVEGSRCPPPRNVSAETKPARGCFVRRLGKGGKDFRVFRTFRLPTL